MAAIASVRIEGAPLHVWPEIVGSLLVLRDAQFLHADRAILVERNGVAAGVVPGRGGRGCGGVQWAYVISLARGQATSGHLDPLPAGARLRPPSLLPLARIRHGRSNLLFEQIRVPGSCSVLSTMQSSRPSLLRRWSRTDP